MVTRIGRIVLVASAVAACLARPAAAQPSPAESMVRGSRRVSFGLSPAWPWMAAHDVTAPLPALRLGVNFSPRVAVDLTAGTFQYSSFGGWSLVDLGARWFFADGNVSPYLMGRAGEYFVNGDETPDKTYLYATLGGGIEYAGDGGLTAWVEAGPALIDGNGGAYVSIGVGYRFGSPPR